MNGFSQKEKLELLDLFNPENNWKNSIIAKSLSSSSSRAALAQSMVSSVRTQMTYNSVGRKILSVQELPQSIINVYRLPKIMSVMLFMII